MRDAVRVHRDIFNLYLADMAKYAPNPTDVARARDVWNSVPGQLAKENHKFQYSQVRSGGKASPYEGGHLVAPLGRARRQVCARVLGAGAPAPAGGRGRLQGVRQ